MSSIYVNYLYLVHSEMISETKYVHTCGTQTSFFKKTIFVKTFSVVGTLCAVWVHILCLTIHFLAVQIWYFNVTKNQNRTSRLSWKVGGVKDVTDLCMTFSQRFISVSESKSVSCMI